ncbi:MULTISPECIES: hypothetical protein [unclassified Rubrivivax]|uniref:hypothetical protein n=1 Tax=unclassified Rubrivivax TaxID=2649762 RepID=UPI001E438A55|nr:MULTISPECIES: hypothetical protein [unclassified Rubrivivax]MCC9597843.1 hypothetical protein [Rubrivivax sp. JA1055]MCC9645900.1 hypothetical protein [Rubrivivax sp. JA1029]MCD0417998.1 hypothetical protein [Rubrivivax sp. JA1024]
MPNTRPANAVRTDFATDSRVRSGPPGSAKLLNGGVRVFRRPPAVSAGGARRLALHAAPDVDRKEGEHTGLGDLPRHD